MVASLEWVIRGNIHKLVTTYKLSNKKDSGKDRIKELRASCQKVMLRPRKVHVLKQKENGTEWSIEDKEAGNQ